MCYKILHDLVDTDLAGAVIYSHFNHVTRGNSLKVVKRAVATERDKSFFTNRIVNIWNALPDSVVSSPTLADFKRHVCFDFSKFLQF